MTGLPAYRANVRPRRCWWRQRLPLDLRLRREAGVDRGTHRLARRGCRARRRCPRRRRRCRETNSSSVLGIATGSSVHSDKARLTACPQDENPGHHPREQLKNRWHSPSEHQLRSDRSSSFGGGKMRPADAGGDSGRPLRRPHLGVKEPDTCQVCPKPPVQGPSPCRHARAAPSSPVRAARRIIRDFQERRRAAEVKASPASRPEPEQHRPGTPPRLHPEAAAAATVVSAGTIWSAMPNSSS